jgi:hypothetical protein
MSSQSDPVSASTSTGGEDKKERATRRWNEMLQELRVAQTGVQVLTGFLLTVPFTQRFPDLGATDKTALLFTLSTSIMAAGLLIAPVAFHRVLFGKSEKEWVVRAANISARVGLTMLGLTMTGVMFLVFHVVVGTTAAIVASAVTVAVLIALWLVVPYVGGEVIDD